MSADERSLEHLGRALAGLDPELVDDAGAPPDDLGDRVVSHVKTERSLARRRRLLIALGAVAASAAAVVIVVALTVGGDEQDKSNRVAFEVKPAESIAWFVLTDIGDDTEIELGVGGLEPGVTYWVWLANASNQGMIAGTFTGTSWEHTMTFTAGLDLEAAARIWVSGPDDEVVLDKML